MSGQDRTDERDREREEVSRAIILSLCFTSLRPPPSMWFNSTGGVNGLMWDLPFTTPTSCNTAFAIIIADVGPPIVHPPARCSWAPGNLMI